MKKIICLLLALVCVFSFISCGEGNVDETNPNKAFFDAIAATSPAKIKTLTSYAVEGSSTPLVGEYETLINEDGFVFAYSYQRYATLQDAENEELEIKGNIVTESGKVYFKNGKYSVDNENWFSETPSVAANQIKLDVKEENLGDFEMNDAKTTLTTTLSPEAAEALLGMKITASSDITVTIRTNGTYLTRVTVSYTTANATVTVDTSYS